jgi:hypothetical protein
VGAAVVHVMGSLHAYQTCETSALAAQAEMGYTVETDWRAVGACRSLSTTSATEASSPAHSADDGSQPWVRPITLADELVAKGRSPGPNRRS